MYLAVLGKNAQVNLALLGMGEDFNVVALLKWLIVDCESVLFNK